MVMYSAMGKWILSFENLPVFPNYIWTDVCPVSVNLVHFHYIKPCHESRQLYINQVLDIPLYSVYCPQHDKNTINEMFKKCNF